MFGLIKNQIKTKIGIVLPASYPASRVTLTNGSTVEDIIGKVGGSGLANSLVYREEITSITADMWANIANGSFKGLHAGMHYTAPSGRTYWFADADYFIGSGSVGSGTEQTNHHMLVVEDEITITAKHHTSNTTSGGAIASDIYTTVLPNHQSELETDFGAAHIIAQDIVLSNAVSSGSPSGWDWATKSSQLLNSRMAFGAPICNSGNTGEVYNGGNRFRQASIFRAMPELVIARFASDNSRSHWWLDDVESNQHFGGINNEGILHAAAAAVEFGVRRAFLIG